MEINKDIQWIDKHIARGRKVEKKREIKKERVSVRKPSVKLHYELHVFLFCSSPLFFFCLLIFFLIVYMVIFKH